MSDELIQCPSCRHQLAVPPELLGQTVQCPECGTNFEAPAPRRASAALGANFDTPRPLPSREEPVGLVLFAVLGMIIIGVIGLVISAINVVGIVNDPDAFVKPFIEPLREMEQKDPNFQLPPDLPETMVGIVKIVSLIGVFTSIAGILAGVLLGLRKMYGVTVLLTLVGACNVGFLCCLPSAIISVLSLFVLFNPAVKARFQ